MNVSEPSFGPPAKRSPFDDALPAVSFAWTRPDCTFMAGSAERPEEASKEQMALIQSWISCLEKNGDLQSAHDRAVRLVGRTIPDASDGPRRVISALYAGLTATMLDRVIGIHIRTFEVMLQEQIVNASYAEYESRLASKELDSQKFLKELEARRLSVIRLMGQQSKAFPGVVDEVQDMLKELDHVVPESELLGIARWTSQAWKTPFQVKVSKVAREAIDDLDELVRMVKLGPK